MENRVFARYNFETETDTNEFRIVDKFGHKDDLVFDGQFEDLSILDVVGPNIMVLYANYLDNPRYGDVYIFDGKNHALTHLASNCLSQFSYSKSGDNVVKLTTKDNNGTPVFIFATRDAKTVVTSDKQQANALSKQSVTTNTIHTFENGKLLRKNDLVDAFGYQTIVFETLDPETGEKERIGATDKAHMSYDKNHNPVLRYVEDGRKCTCHFSSEGTMYNLQQSAEEDNGRSVIYENYDYALVQEEIEADEFVYFNLYILKFNNCTDETYKNLYQYFDTDDTKFLDKAIADDDSLTPIAEGLIAPPQIKYSNDGMAIDVRYNTQDHTCFTRITQDGNPYTISKPTPYQA